MKNKNFLLLFFFSWASSFILFHYILPPWNIFWDVVASIPVALIKVIYVKQVYDTIKKKRLNKQIKVSNYDFQRNTTVVSDNN